MYSSELSLSEERPMQSNEEVDNLNRSSKKIKTGNQSSPSELKGSHVGSPMEGLPSLEESVKAKGTWNENSTTAISYKEMVSDIQSDTNYKRFDKPFWEDEMVYEEVEEELPLEEQDPNCPLIFLTAEEKERIRKPWKDAIIIKVLDNHLGYMYLRRKLQQKWSPKGPFLMSDIGNDFYVVKFSNQEDLSFVLTQGPWLIGESYLTIQRWRPNFFASEEKLRYVAAWIRIPNLSMEYFDRGVLSMIGKHIGKVLKIDKTTMIGERGRYTRMCVEIDMEKPLISKFRMIGRIWRIQYEGFKLICFGCGKIGHNLEKCPEEHPTQDGHKSEEERVLDELTKWKVHNPEYMNKYGKWMIPEPTTRKVSDSWQGNGSAKNPKKPQDSKGKSPTTDDPGDGFAEHNNRKNGRNGRSGSGTRVDPVQISNDGIIANKEGGSRFAILADMETVMEVGDSSGKDIQDISTTTKAINQEVTIQNSGSMEAGEESEDVILKKKSEKEKKGKQGSNMADAAKISYKKGNTVTSHDVQKEN
ncbi:hypothetical protein V2J09_012756 [Rumex salicifolius]